MQPAEHWCLKSLAIVLGFIGWRLQMTWPGKQTSDRFCTLNSDGYVSNLGMVVCRCIFSFGFPFTFVFASRSSGIVLLTAETLRLVCVDMRKPCVQQHTHMCAPLSQVAGSSCVSIFPSLATPGFVLSGDLVELKLQDCSLTWSQCRC